MQRVESIRPDVIVCTGDVADEPDEERLLEAKQYLLKLAKHCKLEPSLIVTPGNHDYRKGGYAWTGRDEPYFRVFGDFPKSHFYEAQSVWIYRFDSASEGGTGGSGMIGEEEIAAFHNEFEKLHRTKPGFGAAFKIAIVHHHPLPVNWDYNSKDRWLTMANAGSFLSMLLARRFDLILHGHEHLQCKSRLWSTLGGEDKELTVISLGATLRKVGNPSRNWYGHVRIESNGAAFATFHASTGSKFDRDPSESVLAIRSPESAARMAFEETRRKVGFHYDEVAVNMTLMEDGDGWGSVEYRGFRVSNPESPRRRRHTLNGPDSTDIYHLDCFHSAGDAAPNREINAQGGVDLVFEPPIATGVDANYWYRSWWVNAFAMDGDEFRYMYPPEQAPGRIEYLHQRVVDPIGELSFTVQFPDGFEPEGSPRIRVTRPVEGKRSRFWPRIEELEAALNRSPALRYYVSLGLAHARIPYPEPGLAYGIEWRVPDCKQPRTKPLTQKALDVRAMTACWDTGLDAEQESKLITVLGQALISARKTIMNDWKGHAEASFCRFDSTSQSLRILAAVEGGELVHPVDHSGIQFRYGRGIVGRAFKTNKPRWYIREHQKYQEEPGFYQAIEGQTPHEVLLSIPIGVPGDEPIATYGVMSFGSTKVNCPMKLSLDIERILEFQRGLEKFLDRELWTIFQV